MDISIKIEDGNVIIYGPGGGRRADLGTMRPDDHQLCRVIYRAIEFGKREKEREIRATLGL
jgi:hypothetical protein